MPNQQPANQQLIASLDQTLDSQPQFRVTDRRGEYLFLDSTTLNKFQRKRLRRGQLIKADTLTGSIIAINGTEVQAYVPDLDRTPETVSWYRWWEPATRSLVIASERCFRSGNQDARLELAVALPEKVPPKRVRWSLFFEETLCLKGLNASKAGQFQTSFQARLWEEGSYTLKIERLKDNLFASASEQTVRFQLDRPKPELIIGRDTRIAL